MYYKKFIEFLKTHNLYDEQIISYWTNHSIHFDYKDDEKRDMICCLYVLKDQKLEKLALIVPFIVDDKTILINIHEYIHFYLLYQKLGKKYTHHEDAEVLPFLYEQIFIKENQTRELKEYYKYLNTKIKEDSKKEYLIALEVSNKMIAQYQNEDISILDKKVKKLVKNLDKHS